MKVLVFGSLNIDHVYKVDHIVAKGETLGSKSYQIYPGGKGLNQSVALAKAGTECYHAGLIGLDGTFLLDVLSEAGVDVSLVQVLADGNTGHAIIQNDATGDNCILLYDGANKQITEAYVEQVLAQFQAGDVIVLQNEINQLRLIMKYAHERGMTIVFNPAPMDEAVKDLPLEYVDYLIVNEIEAGQLMNLPADDIEGLVDAISHGGMCPNVILTLGEKGAVCMKQSGEVMEQKAYPAKAVDTTAAGDTFIGYLVAGLTKGAAIAEAMDTAARAAAITVTRSGAAVSIPAWTEL